MGTHENILCIMPFTLGDSICILPELRIIAEKHGRPVDIFIKKPHCARLYDGLEYIGNVFHAKHWNSFLLLYLRAAPIMRRGRYTHYYFMNGQTHGRKFLRIFPFVKTVPDQITFGFPDELWKSTTPHSPVLRTTEEERAEMRALLRSECGWTGGPLVLMHPGSSYVEGRRRGVLNSREWPRENWRAVLSGIAAGRPDALCVFTGSERERGLTEGILAGASANAVSLAGKLSLRRLFALQALADSCISMDTGPAHSALASGCPTLVLYDREDPRHMGLCSPKGWGPAVTLRGFRDAGDMPEAPVRNIRPETVLRLWENLPPRRSEPTANGLVPHYREGAAEPEVMPIWRE